MEKFRSDILEKIRQLFFNQGVRSVSMDDISRELGLSRKQLNNYFSNKKDLVRQLLDMEREQFEIIFDTDRFDGDVNAIDILLMVSKELDDKFTEVSPSMTYDMKKYYPDIYNKHVEERIESINEKIRINLEKGIKQGMYRNDLSVELVSRLYIRRLMDLHDPEIFPADKFSFQTLFEVMFDHFIRGIANEKGIFHYEKQKNKISL